MARKKQSEIPEKLPSRLNVDAPAALFRVLQEFAVTKSHWYESIRRNDVSVSPRISDALLPSVNSAHRDEEL